MPLTVIVPLEPLKVAPVPDFEKFVPISRDPVPALYVVVDGEVPD